MKGLKRNIKLDKILVSIGNIIADGDLLKQRRAGTIEIARIITNYFGLDNSTVG